MNNHHTAIQVCDSCQKIPRAMFYCEHCGAKIPGSKPHEELLTEPEAPKPNNGRTAEEMWEDTFRYCR